MNTDAEYTHTHTHQDRKFNHLSLSKTQVIIFHRFTRNRETKFCEIKKLAQRENIGKVHS